MSPDRSSAVVTPWLVLLTVSLSAMSVLGNSIGMVSLLLPRMMAEYGVDVPSIQWVLTAFMLTMVVIMPAVGWLGSAFGQRRLYLVSVTLFTICTLACTLAWNYPSLIVLRVIQGAAAGCFFPLTTPFIFDVFPEGRRGFVLGISNLTLITGSVLGSLIASSLSDHFGWRWGFYYVIVLCLGAIVLGSIVLREPPRSRVGRFDVPGALTLGTALVSAVLLITQRDLRLSTETLSLGGLCLVSIVAFLWIESRAKEPLVDLGIFRHLAFAAGSSLGFIVPAATTATTLLLPIFLQRIQGYSIFQSALLRIPSGLTTAFVSPFTGWLSDRMDPRLLVTTGILGFAGALYALSTLTIQSSGATVAALLVVMGLVSMFIWTPLANTMFSALPAESIRLGAGLHALMRQLGRSVGGALIAVLFSSRATARVTRVFGGMAASSTILDYHVHRISTWMGSTHHPDPGAYTTQFLYQTLTQEATVAAFGDCYRLTAVLFLAAVLPVHYLKRKSSGN